MCRENGPRWAAFPCTPLRQFAGAHDAAPNSFRCQGMFGFAKPHLVSGKRAGRTCREGPWMSLEPAPRGSPLEHSRSRGTASSVLVGPRGGCVLFNYLLGTGFARTTGNFKAICCSRVLWDPKEIESSPRWREPLPPGRVPPAGSTKGRRGRRARGWSGQPRSPLYLTI